MKHTLLLAFRYLTYYRLRSAIIVVCIALTFFLPVAVSLLVSHFEDVMTMRSRKVPLVVGAKGSRYELLLSSLYFRGRPTDLLPMAETLRLRESGRAAVAPVLVRHTVRGHSVVATTPVYYEQMGLNVCEGTKPLVLGDALLGAAVAESLGAGPGDRITSDTSDLISLAASYPVRMRITGVLPHTGGPDDDVVFVDLKTGWLLDGIAHGHQDLAAEVNEAAVLKRSDDQVVVDSSIVHYVEVTPENIGSFHFHGDQGTFPTSAILVWPHDTKASDILRAWYRPEVSKSAQVIVPMAVSEDLMGLLFQLKRFFDANVLMIGLSTALFLGLIIFLTLRIRRREMETLRKIGCGRGRVFSVHAAEIGIVLAFGLILAGVLSILVYWYVVESSPLL